MAADCVGADLVHSHTWYANMAGHLGVAAGRHPARGQRPQPGAAAAVEGRAARRRLRHLLLGRAHGVRVGGRHHRRQRRHARRRPEELPLGRPGQGPRRAQRHRLPAAGRRAEDPDVVRRHGVDPDRPSVVFVGRITRQKGLPYFLRAARALPPEVQIVLCAGAPDTPEIKAEVEALIADLRADARRRRLDPRDAAARRGRRAAQRRHRLRLPVGLRAARHRQPRGHGLRAGGRRDGDRRHPRGRGRRRDRLAGADRAGRRRQRHPRGPRRVRRRPRRRAERGASATRTGRARSGGPAGPGRSSTSPGTPSATRRSRSTAPSSAEPRSAPDRSRRSGVLARRAASRRCSAPRRWRRSRRPGRRSPAAR